MAGETSRWRRRKLRVEPRAALLLPSVVAAVVLAAAGSARGQDTTVQALPMSYPTLEVYCDGNTGLGNWDNLMQSYNVTCQTSNAANSDTWLLERNSPTDPATVMNSVSADPAFQYTRGGGDNKYKALLNSVRTDTILTSNGNAGGENTGDRPFIARDFSPFNCGLGPSISLGGEQLSSFEKSTDADTFGLASSDKGANIFCGLYREEVGDTRRQIQWPLRDDGKIPGSEFWEWTARMAHWVSDDSNDAPTITAGASVIPGQTTASAHNSSSTDTAAMLDDRSWNDPDKDLGYCVYKALVVTGGTVQGSGTWEQDSNSGSWAALDVGSQSDAAALIVAPGTQFRYSSDGSAGQATLTFRAYDGTEYDSPGTADKQTNIDTTGKQGGKFATSSASATLTYTVTAPGPSSSGTTSAATVTTSSGTSSGSVTSTSSSGASTSSSTISGTTSSAASGGGTTGAGAETESAGGGDDSTTLIIIIVAAAALCCIVVLVVIAIVVKRSGSGGSASGKKSSDSGAGKSSDGSGSAEDEEDSKVVVYANVNDMEGVGSDDGSDDGSSNSEEVVYASMTAFGGKDTAGKGESSSGSDDDDGSYI